MAELYIGFVDTPGIFAWMIRRVLKQKYVHVVLGLDPWLHEAYSIGRRNPAIPFFAGFEKEEKKKILNVFPNADYEVRKLKCTEMQRKMIEEKLYKDYEQRKKFHYTIEGLVYVLLQKPYFRSNYYTCSSYVADCLQQADVVKWDKDFSCVTPKDFYDRKDMEMIFRGSLRDLDEKDQLETSLQKEENWQTGAIVYGQ